MTASSPITIRPWTSADSLARLTDLLHRAYRPLAEAGMRFVASHQDEAHTAGNIAKGACLVAEIDGVMVGAVNCRRPGAVDGCEWYARPGVSTFGQFAVEPGLQKRGIGDQLLRAVEDHARQQGDVELALDTSERATHLISYYAKRGYRHIGHVQWSMTNYRSVVMSKSLNV